jgi:hypothetical protein
VAREQLISQLVADALKILAALEDVKLDGPQSEAVGLLALVAGQDVEPGQNEPGGSPGARPRIG